MNTIGRNDPCHCGSGKKYKKCHLEKDESDDRKQREKAALNAAKQIDPAAAIEPARGSVLGNVFNARGPTPAVLVSAAGECLFNDNRVDAKFNTKTAVILLTTAAIVNANRVRGGRQFFWCAEGPDFHSDQQRGGSD